MDYITQSQWLPLNRETRVKLRDIFYIPNTGMVEVVTDEFGRGTVKSDGHTNTDLQVITVEKLVDFVGSAAINESIYDLFKRAVDKVERNIVDTYETSLKQDLGLTVKVAKEMNTSDNQLKCDSCSFTTGSERGLKIHKAKHRDKTKL